MPRQALLCVSALFLIVAAGSAAAAEAMAPPSVPLPIVGGTCDGPVDVTCRQGPADAHYNKYCTVYVSSPLGGFPKCEGLGIGMSE